MRSPDQHAEMEESETALWFNDRQGELFAQTLRQANGHAISLLWLKPDDDNEDEGEVEDTFDRFAALSKR